MRANHLKWSTPYIIGTSFDGDQLENDHRRPKIRGAKHEFPVGHHFDELATKLVVNIVYSRYPLIVDEIRVVVVGINATYPS